MNENKRREEQYKIFMEERKTLISTSNEQANQYSKAVMALAGLFLGFSLTFIKEIAPDPIPPETYPYLILSWISFGSSLLCVVLAFLVAQYAFLRQVSLSQEAILNPSGKKTPQNSKICFINILNFGSFIFFLLGIVSLLIFSGINLIKNC